MQDSSTKGQLVPEFPNWVPVEAQRYIAHTEFGHPIRAIARQVGCHASTILRQIRRTETRRDDPLVDAALRAVAHAVHSSGHPDFDPQETHSMTAPLRQNRPNSPDEKTVDREARRILRRLAESGAVLAAARDMEKAVVVREGPDGRSTRTAVVDRDVAQAMALKEWISCQTQGRITRYEITATGRAALKRLIAEDKAQKKGEVAGLGFAEQHRDWEEREIPGLGADRRSARVRYNLAESPLTALGRRRDKDGKPFLSPELISAGERLREDFELAQMGPRVAQNWESFLTGGARPKSLRPSTGGFDGPGSARDRVSAALRDLGPGLGDVALRCCCFLEGMETTEKRLGWSARSGKIVLRIALQRLRQHYDETEGRAGPLIG